jgi:Flp pilus assembly protein TadG
MKGFRAEDGQSLVETAVCLPLLLGMFLGMAEFGKLIYTAIAVTNSAKAAAQYATMNGGAFSATDRSGLDTTGMLTAAQSDAGFLGGNIAFTSTPSYSCACADGTTNYSCNVAGAIPSGCAGSRLIVTVTVHTQGVFVSDIKIPGIASSYTIQGRAIEEVLQ